MEEDRGSSNQSNDYFKEMAIAEGGNAPSYSSPLKNAAARDLPNKMIEKSSSQETPTLHDPIAEIGRESKRRKMEEQGGKSTSPFDQQKRMSQLKELLFGKTLTSTDCKDFLAISTENALAHFPSLLTSELGDFSVIETLDILHLKYLGNIWRMSFVYSFDRKSYGISKGWNEFVTKYNLKAGDMVYYYKTTHPALDKYNLYYIDCDVEKETTETESTATSAEIKTIKIYGYELNYLFEKALTPLDVNSENWLDIPTQKGEKHFDPLDMPMKPYGRSSYCMDLKVYDACQAMWDMQIHLITGRRGRCYISGSWNDFVYTHKLRGKDVIRFFKMVNNVSNDGCYLMDYVKAKE